MRCGAFDNRIFLTNCPRKISMHALALLFTITSSPCHWTVIIIIRISNISIPTSHVECLSKLQAAISDFSLADSRLIKLAKVGRVKLKRFYCSRSYFRCEIAIRPLVGSIGNLQHFLPYQRLIQSFCHPSFAFQSVTVFYRYTGVELIAITAIDRYNDKSFMNLKFKSTR